MSKDDPVSIAPPPEVHRISQPGSCTTEEARPAMLRILQSALAEVTSWHDDPSFYNCYGYGEDDNKVPGLMAQLTLEITALLEPQMVSTTDAATGKVFEEWHITVDAEGHRDYNDEITWGPRARGVLPGPFFEEISFTGETPQPFTLRLTRYCVRGCVTHTNMQLHIGEVKPDVEVTHG